MEKKNFPICLIFQEPIFIFCVLSISTLFFVIKAIQYWASDYMLTVLQITNEPIRVFLDGPVKRKIDDFIICAASFSITVSLVNNLWLFTLFLW